MKFATMIAAASLAAFALAEETAPQSNAPAAPAVERARPPRRGPERMRNPGMMMQDPIARAVANPRIAEKIGLTAEQKAKLGDAADLRAKSRELQEKSRKATARQMELLAAETIDEAAVMAAIDESFEAKKALAKEQTKRLIVIRSVLTPEQVKAIHAELKAMRERNGRAGQKRGAVPPAGAPKAAPKKDAPKGE